MSGVASSDILGQKVKKVLITKTHKVCPSIQGNIEITGKWSVTKMIVKLCANIFKVSNAA